MLQPWTCKCKNSTNKGHIVHSRTNYYCPDCGQNNLPPHPQMYTNCLEATTIRSIDHAPSDPWHEGQKVATEQAPDWLALPKTVRTYTLPGIMSNSAIGQVTRVRDGMDDIRIAFSRATI